MDFEAQDSSGTKQLLSGLKGKVIFIDLWATWCGPCLEEMPYYEKLKKHYKGREDIAFVSLSIDDSKAAWLNSLKQRNTNGIQWIINRNNIPEYRVQAVPRSIIITKDFTVAQMFGPMPSEQNAKIILDEFLNK